MTFPFQTVAGLYRRIVPVAVLTAYIVAGLFGHLSVGDDDVYLGRELRVTEKKAASVSISQRPLWTKKRHYPPVPAFSIADIHHRTDPFTVPNRPCSYRDVTYPLRSSQLDATVRIPRPPPILSL